MKVVQKGWAVVRRAGWYGMVIWLLGSSAARARAELRFAERSLDVGEVWTGRPLAYRFHFVNAGPEPIEMTDLKASCGCLTPQLTRRTFAAGEHGSILLEVNTLSHAAGPHTWTLEVHYRAGQAERIVPLQISALVREEIIVQPAGLTVFTSGPASHEITLTDTRTKPLAIRAIRSSSAALSAQVTEEFRDARGHLARKIRVAVAGDFPEGRHDETLAIATDDPAYPELKVMVTVHKTQRQRVTAMPEQLSWRVDGMAALPSQMVRLRDQRDEPVVVERIVADDPAVTCRWAAGPGSMATVKISVDRKRLKTGPFQSAVQVHVSKPMSGVVTIPVVVSGQ